MIRLSGKYVEGQRVYALVCPDVPGEAPEHVVFGFAPDLARLALGWKMGNWLPVDTRQWTQDQADEASAMIEAIRDPAIDAWGYRLIDAGHRITREAAWLLDLDDIRPYYEGPSGADEYAIREWCAQRLGADRSIVHALLDMMVEHDRRLSPALTRQMHRQIDE